VLQSTPSGINTPPAAFVEGAGTDTISSSSTTTTTTTTSSQAAAAAVITGPGSSSCVERPSPSAVGLLSGLGVSQDSLQRLFTAGCADDFEQPAWMVVNLQVSGMAVLTQHWIVTQAHQPSCAVHECTSCHVPIRRSQ